MWYFLAVIVAAGIVAMQHKAFLNKAGEPDLKAMGVRFGKYFVMLFVAAICLDSVTIIPAGNRGVVFDAIKGVKHVPLGEGLNFVTPIIQTCYTMSVQIEKSEHEATASSKDMQEVHTTVTVNYRVSPETAWALFQNVGLSFVDKIITPAIQEVVKASTALYTAEELITKREIVKQSIQTALAKLLAKEGIVLTETYITNFQFSKAFNEAIEQKQVAEQEALKAQRNLARVKFEADQAITKARAEATGLQLQQAAVTPLLLELRRVEMMKTYIEKWNGTLPQVVMGGGGGGMTLWDMSRYLSPKKAE
jgi:regulator of protease activity HflC (stomatin/prohibitin superfamily)